MHSILYVFHLILGVGLGFFLLLPWWTARLSRLSGLRLTGYLMAIQHAVVAGHWLIWLVIVTGGALLWFADRPVYWIYAVLAISGSVAWLIPHLSREIGKAAGEKELEAIRLERIRNLSFATSVCILLMVVLMGYPHLF
ncbi:hypothetical protein [Desmospora profundinema]|uniref:DUF2269 family protein n=1 Tax=Desmospora profundinema TaxID=1571184 RepID=A0ABU1IJ15_9BACL|nr:hypothetical protein [Desmospora profundinema]MDR6224542.1 hypothetical protein [Desmospora profundinema]